MPLIGIGKVDLEAINRFAQQAAADTPNQTQGRPVERRHSVTKDAAGASKPAAV